MPFRESGIQETGSRERTCHQLKEEPFYGCHEPSLNTSHRAKGFPGHWTLQAGAESRSWLEPPGAPSSVALQRGRAPSAGSRRTAGRPRVVHHAFGSESCHPGHQRLHHAPRAGEGQGGVDSAFSSSLIRSRSHSTLIRFQAPRYTIGLLVPRTGAELCVRLGASPKPRICRHDCSSLFRRK